MQIREEARDGTLVIQASGRLDSSSAGALEAVLRVAAELDGPAVVHVLTRKGEGYGPAETDEEKRLHDIGAFDPETGVPQASSASSFTGAFAAELVRLGERHPELVAITAGMPGSTGLLPFAERFPDRCLDVDPATWTVAAAGPASRARRSSRPGAASRAGPAAAPGWAAGRARSAARRTRRWRCRPPGRRTRRTTPVARSRTR